MLNGKVQSIAANQLHGEWWGTALYSDRCWKEFQGASVALVCALQDSKAWCCEFVPPLLPCSLCQGSTYQCAGSYHMGLAWGAAHLDTWTRGCNFRSGWCSRCAAFQCEQRHPAHASFRCPAHYGQVCTSHLTLNCSLNLSALYLQLCDQINSSSM